MDKVNEKFNELSKNVNAKFEKAKAKTIADLYTEYNKNKGKVIRINRVV